MAATPPRRPRTRRSGSTSSEKRLAEPILRPEDFNDPGNYYQPRPIADLIAANPDFDWPAFLEHLGIPEEETIVVTELEYLSAVDAILAKTDLETLKDYLKLQILLSTASALSEEMGQTLFDFYGTTLNGVEEREPLAERALGDVNGALGFALGQLYVDEHFPPEAKAEIEKLVARLIAATRVRIEALDWMSPETKGDGPRQTRRHARQGRLPRRVAHVRGRDDRGITRADPAQREPGRGEAAV